MLSIYRLYSSPKPLSWKMFNVRVKGWGDRKRKREREREREREGERKSDRESTNLTNDFENIELF